MSDKPTLAVDFDGVLHAYTSGWQGANVVADGPVPGAMQWLSEATKQFEVVIYSSRSSQDGGVEAMRNAIRKWMHDYIEQSDNYKSHGYADKAAREFVSLYLSFPVTKPAAFLTIDDRAIQFNGDFSSLRPDRLREFKPWNKD